MNYAGGFGSALGTGYWRHVSKHNVCGPYMGPPLFGLVKACTAPDGSNWALQVWQRGLRDNGWKPRTRTQSAWELHVSHWSGPLPDLWFRGRLDLRERARRPVRPHLRDVHHRGNPIYGFSSTSAGAPTDSFGRLVYMDTLKPPWKTGYRQVGGWYRYNAFLTHRPHGDFCPGVFPTIAGVPRRPRPGRGTQYRTTANGPGVTPVVSWRDYGPGYYVPGLGNLRPTRNTRGPYKARLDHGLMLTSAEIHPDAANSCYDSTHQL